MTDAHVEKETLTVDVNIPQHADRVATPLFSKTRQTLIDAGGTCWVCGELNSKESPLEAHHLHIERCLAEMIDWALFIKDAEAGLLGDAVKNFDWRSFSAAVPFNPYAFVDDMTVNGQLLCKKHHTGADEGKHTMPEPLWKAQRWAKEGYRFNSVEIVHHFNATGV